MKRLLVAVLPSLLAAACSSGSNYVPADFRGPSAVAAYWGTGRSTGALTPWIAVANSRGNELRIIDPQTDLPQRSANLTFALSVPTLERPIHLAAGSLHDGGPDALVVASSGTLVQLVGTWYGPLDQTPVIGVAAQWDLSSLVDKGSEILALTVASIPTGAPAGDPPVYPVVEGKAWVIVAFSGGVVANGGKLVVLEISRGSDGESVVLSGQPAVKPLGFDPAAISLSPDNFHLYFATSDPIPTSGAPVQGVAEVDMSGGVAAAWSVRGLDGRAPTTQVAAAIVGERMASNWYDFQAPVLRVYAALSPTGCGPTQPIACGIATFDPALGGLAADPAPAVGAFPKQSYRAPMGHMATPLALGVALPPANPGTVAPGVGGGSQVCYSPAAPPPGNGLPLCPEPTSGGVPLGVFNFNGVAQKFMGLAALNAWWSSGAGLVASSDGNAYLLDLGRFGLIPAFSAMDHTATGLTVVSAASTVPAGPTPGTADLGPPPDTSALGFVSASGTVDSEAVGLASDVVLAPGFTTTEAWLVSYQGFLPGLAFRRGVLGLGADGASLYLAIQEPYAPPPDGVLPASAPWVPIAAVAAPEFAIHPAVPFGEPADIALFSLDVDPCTSTRPNWVPAGGGAAVYDPTHAPRPHEAPVASFLAPDPILYPVGALALSAPQDATLASEYACLVDALRARPGSVLTAVRTIATTTTEFQSGVSVRAGGFVLVGSSTGYAGRPSLGQRYDFAWAVEEPLSGEALSLARKARRFWYPAYYSACETVGCYPGFPELLDPMQPGPVVAFTLGRYCKSRVTPDDCNPLTSPPARDASVAFTTYSGLTPVVRRPTNASVGTSTTTLDKSAIPGFEYLGRVFYTTFAGGALFDVPPGLDSGNVRTIR